MSIQDGMAKMMEVMQHNVMPAVAAGNDYLEHKVGVHTNVMANDCASVLRCGRLEEQG